MADYQGIMPFSDTERSARFAALEHAVYLSASSGARINVIDTAHTFYDFLMTKDSPAPKPAPEQPNTIPATADDH